MTGNKKHTILIVDDESEIREILGIHAAALGFDYIEATDGERALEIIRDSRKGEQPNIDVIVSDIMMPRMSGMIFLRMLRDEGFNIPFIFITAYPSKDTTLQALRLGAFDFIEKPFEADEIKKLLSEAIRVSTEQKKINETGAVEEKEVNDAELQILKMRALRYNNNGETEQEGQVAGESSNNDYARLRELLVAEALPQLVFCEASVKNLVDHDVRVWELGYLFRVMQTLRTSGEAIGAHKLAEFAREAENLFMIFRVKPSNLRDDHILLLERAIPALRSLVTNLEQSNPSTSESDEVVAQLKALRETLDSDRSYKKAVS